MKSIGELYLARNELENRVYDFQHAFGLTEVEMSVVLEMVISTSRYKALVRNIYDTTKGEDDGNSNEKGQ